MNNFGIEPPFSKNEDEYTKTGWTRVDKSMPGWGQHVKVLGYYYKKPDEMQEDSAHFINTSNIYMFSTHEWIATQFIVLYWKKLG